MIYKINDYRLFSLSNLSTFLMGTENTIQDRFNKIIKYTRLTPAQFGAEIGFEPNRIYRITKGKIEKIGSDVLEKIAAKYKLINIDWLITGRGSMLRQPYQISHQDMITEEIGANYTQELISRVKIHMVSKYTNHQYAQRCTDPEFINTLPINYDLYITETEYRDFEVINNDMVDDYGSGLPEGSIIRAAQVPQPDWFNKTQSGKVLVIVTQTKILIRLVTNTNPQTKTLHLKSIKKNQPITQVTENEIQEIWEYKKLISEQTFFHYLND